MPRLIPRRKMRCHYCGGSSPKDKSLFTTPRSWLCPHCDSVNHLDENGEITDPPFEVTNSYHSLHYARSRSSTPTLPTMITNESPFCKTCLRNQMMVQHALAEYIPDESDPEYDKYLASTDSYRASLEQRYPLVCDNCIGRARELITKAVYGARVDHLQRVLEISKQNATRFHTPAQTAALWVLFIAMLTYCLSILGGVVFHIPGALMAPAQSAGDGIVPDWTTCVSQVFSTLHLESWCFTLDSLRWVAGLAIVADLVTFWWIPQLRQKTIAYGGRMRHLRKIWVMRLVVIGFRTLSFYAWKDISLYTDRELQNVQILNGVMLAVLLLSAYLTCNTVRIEYKSNVNYNFAEPLEPHLPSATNSPPSNTDRSPQRQSVRPNQTMFDTMGQAFTSSFQDSGESYNGPPSPTYTEESTRSPQFPSAATSRFQETPYNRGNTFRDDENEMDWSPTPKRYAQRVPEIIPNVFRREAPSQSPPPPHSIFKQPSANPFHHPVPPAPKPNIPGRQNPWTPGVWTPALPENKENFLNKVMQGRADPTAREALKNNAVPRNVKRNAEIFNDPKLKYDDYGTPKTTGLEDSFGTWGL
ncbi:hypothetical protein K504DRAFT_415963 [Pleomassaria siparia CBS 279.74]|uniref:Ima1 N-terminal domain-containing protein n=1 Tax=Pleomassaria siparia CBS 279.74 TaxID=1314801 RepID=A0A6G1JWR3_9PLEO|nr:hypothetical protein K504DRAFT_415963 [Pleomassaria siparia CBS 279.74]